MGFVTDTIDSITGRGSSKAARRAGNLQAEEAEKARELVRETRDLAREDLAPFAEAGRTQVGELTDRILAPRTNQEIMDIFQPASEVLSDNIAARAAVGGKGLGSGNTLMDLFRENLILGEDLRERRRQQDIGNLTNLVNIGQASAAGQANTALRSGTEMSDLIGTAAASRAAGMVGSQNARNAGTDNLINLASMFLGG